MLIGYALSFALYATFVLILAFIVIERKGIAQLIKEHTNRYSIAALVIILAFFLVVSILWVSPVEQLYFDENIYQGIALNILHNFNALWCQYGTGYVTHCYVNALYHDPIGWSAFIALAFGIFGIGFATAWNLELFVGVMSIFLFFLLASMLFKRPSYAIVSTFGFTMMPELFIWARTQADVDLPFMMFAIFAFLCFIMFTKRKNLNMLGLFAFSLVLVSYMRIEAMLLIPIFAVLMLTFSEKGIRETARDRIKKALHALQRNTAALVLLLVFVLLLAPQAYYVALEAQSPSYGQPQNQSILSIANFNANINPNLQFIFGQINGISFYPAAFHYTITPLAILGLALLILDRRHKNRFGIVILAVLWFFAYFLFYTAFYAGSATYGVDSRFMLQLLPSLVLLAGFAIIELGDAASLLVTAMITDVTAGEARRLNMPAERRKAKLASLITFDVTVFVLSAVLLAYPFYLLVPSVTIAPSAMPQQTVILKAIDTFYGNYTAVPQNCLVFSNTPDIWYEVNRSSAQISYLQDANASLTQNFSQNKCLVFDYGYWCVVPPYHSTLCSQLASRYKYENLTPNISQLGGYNVGFYQVLNYT